MKNLIKSLLAATTLYALAMHRLMAASDSFGPNLSLGADATIGGKTVAPSATTDIMNANNITAGMLPIAQTPSFTGDCGKPAGLGAVDCSNVRAQSNTWGGTQNFTATGNGLFGLGKSLDWSGMSAAYANGSPGMQLMQFGDGGFYFNNYDNNNFTWRGRNYAQWMRLTAGSLTLPAAVSVASADTTANTAANSQNRLSRVANAAALSTWTNYAFPVERDDVAGIHYADTGASCLAPDGGTQIQPAAGHCWVADVSRGLPLSLFPSSFKNNGDDLAAYNAALSALNALGGGTLIVAPPSGTCSNLSGPVVIPYNWITIRFDARACVNANFAAGNVFQFGTDTVATTHDNIYHLNVTHNGTLHTSGADVAFHNANSSIGSDITCSGGRFRCAQVDAGLNVHLDHIETGTSVGQPGGSDVCLGCNLPPNSLGPLNTFIDDSNLTGATGTTASATAAAPSGSTTISGLGTGLELQAVNGLFLNKVNTDQNQVGLWAHPGLTTVNGVSTQLQVSAIFGGAGVYFDSSTRWGVLWDTSAGGKITNVRFTNFWVASCGSPQVLDACVLHTGAGPQQNNQFLNSLILNAQGSGVSVQSTSVVYTKYEGGTFQNNYNNGTSGGAYSGIDLAAGVSHFTYDGNCGQLASVANFQAYCMNVQPGTGDYIEGSGDWSGNVTGTLNAPNVSGTHNSFGDIRPYVPLQNYSLTVTAASGTAPTATVTEARWTKRGTMAFFTARVQITSSSGSGALQFSLPIAADSSAGSPTIVTGREESTGHVMLGVLSANQNVVQILDGTNNGYPGVNGYTVVISGSYPIYQP